MTSHLLIGKPKRPGLVNPRQKYFRIRIHPPQKSKKYSRHKNGESLGIWELGRLCDNQEVATQTIQQPTNNIAVNKVEEQN